MKIEPRGKFGGVKIHLDADEAQRFLDINPNIQSGTDIHFSWDFARSLREKTAKLLKQTPNLLQDKTDAEVATELNLEKTKAEKKLAAMAAGHNWKEA